VRNCPFPVQSVAWGAGLERNSSLALIYQRFTTPVASGKAYGRSAEHRTGPCACVHLRLGNRFSNQRYMASVLNQLGRSVVLAVPIQMAPWRCRFEQGLARRLPPPEARSLRSSFLFQVHDSLRAHYQLASVPAGWPPAPMLSKASFPGLQFSG